MNSNTIAIRITVNDDGSHVIQQFGKTAGSTFRQLDADSGKASTALLGLKNSYIAMAAAAAAAAASVMTAWNLAESAAGYLEQMQLLDGLAQRYGTTAQSIVNSIRTVSDGMISMSTAAEVSAAALAKNLKPDQIIKLAEAAKTLADYMGSTVNDAFRTLNEALETGRVKALKQAVGLIDLEARYGDAAKSMSEAEKQQAMFNIVIERAAALEAQAGSETKSLADQMETLRVAAEDVKIVFGIGLIKAGAMLVNSWNGIAMIALTVSAGIWKIVEAQRTLRSYASWGDAKTGHQNVASAASQNAADNMRRVSELAKKSGDNWKIVTASVEDMTRATRRGTASFSGFGAAAGGKAAKGISDVERAAKKAREEMGRLVEKADEFIRKVAQDVELGSLTGLRKALRENEIEYENTLKTYEKLTGTKKAEAEAAALSIKAMKDQQAVGKETEDQRKKAVDAAKEMAEREKRLADIEKEKADKIKEAYEAYLKMIDGAARFYSEISGYENQYRDYAFKVIDEEAKARAQMYKDDVAAAKWAAERKGEFEQELFERKARLVSDGFGDMATAFDGISRLYEEGSEDAKKWEEASQAMEIAQRAVAVVNAVAAIANQGLGDPYTAFARIAAMAAAMGALLATIGESVGGGGGGGSSSKPYAYSGPDTVLGGAEGEASQSVQKSMELLQDTYSMEYEQLSRLNDQVKELNLNITGLVAGVLRDVGVNVNSFGIKSGTTPGLAHSTYEKYFENIIGSMAGNPFKMFGLNKPIAALIGGYDPLGAMLTKLVAPLFGKVANALFGGDVEVSKKGSGIGITFGSGAGKYSGAPKSTMTIADLMAGREAYVYNYAKAKITTDGGLFGSDKTEKVIKSAAASDDISRMFGLVFENMSMTLFELGKGLGADMAAVMGYAFQSFRLDFRKKSEEEIQKMIEDQINLMADTAAAALFGSLIKQYQQLDEGLYQTAIRLVQEKAVVGELMEMTNIAFPDAAGAAIEFSRSLIDLAGDLETLQEAVGNYYDKFFSDAEKQARLQLNLSEIMGQFNQQLPAARDGYRAIVESLDMTTDYGKEAYITLISLADSADKYYSYLEDQAGSFDQEMQNNASLFRTREDYIRALNTGKSEDTPEARDRKEMLAELKQLRTAMEAQGYQTVKNTKKTADIIEEWKIIGMPVTQAA